MAVAKGMLLLAWPVPGRPVFASVTARPISTDVVWVHVLSQDAAVAVDDARIRPSSSDRRKDYDRIESRQVEGETLKLLEAMEAEPTAWELLSRIGFERELALQQITQLGA